MRGERVGTGSGYQAAVLSRLAGKVFSIEIRPELAAEATERLKAIGATNVQIRTADGFYGWPEEAPFDGILVTAAPETVPEPLLAQLAPGGRMVIPVGGFYQELKVIERTPEGFRERSVLPVRFVPFVGEAERHRGDRRPGEGGHAAGAGSRGKLVPECALSSRQLSPSSPVWRLTCPRTSIRACSPVRPSGPTPSGTAFPRGRSTRSRSTRQGFLWVGTQDGAARFNGRDWTRFDMPDRTVSNFVRAVLPARDGSLWFGREEGGLVRLRDG